MRNACQVTDKKKIETQKSSTSEIHATPPPFSDKKE